jgi:hypothetical protein
MPSQERKAVEKFNDYIKTYSGRELLKKHSLDETGIWKIRGEDPNCELGGYHHRPDLGIVSGTLRDVIMYGVNLDKFWQWGAGGNFELIGREIPVIDANSLEVRRQLQEEASKLEERLAEIKRQLGTK